MADKKKKSPKQVAKPAKKGKKKDKVKKVKGFVMNKKTGHVSYAFKQSYDNVESLGFTHNPQDKADKKKLKHNINPEDKSDCFVKTKVEKERSNNYRSKSAFDNYRIHKDDKKTIQKITKTKKRSK